MEKHPLKSLTVWAGILSILAACIKVAATGQIGPEDEAFLVAGLGIIGFRRAMG